MELADFKRIFWYEYVHRQIGRFIGLSFTLPAAYFILRKKVNAPLRNRLLLIGSMIGGQVPRASFLRKLRRDPRSSSTQLGTARMVHGQVGARGIDCGQ